VKEDAVELSDVQKTLLQQYDIRVQDHMGRYVIAQVESVISGKGHWRKRAHRCADGARDRPGEVRGGDAGVMIIKSHAYARAGLVGNPSDGYFGKTISFVIRNFKATVTLWESPHFEIIPSHGDLARFDSVANFLRDTKLHGYYGGLAADEAIVKKFHEHCAKNNVTLHERNFTLSFESDIPRLVGLAGSSAIITATLRALMKFYEVEIPKELMPGLILSAEKEELGIRRGCRIA
jgi:hypothetical protein